MPSFANPRGPRGDCARAGVVTSSATAARVSIVPCVLAIAGINLGIRIGISSSAAPLYIPKRGRSLDVLPGHGRDLTERSLFAASGRLTEHLFQRGQPDQCLRNSILLEREEVERLQRVMADVLRRPAGEYHLANVTVEEQHL